MNRTIDGLAVDQSNDRALVGAELYRGDPSWDCENVRGGLEVVDPRGHVAIVCKSGRRDADIASIGAEYDLRLTVRNRQGLRGTASAERQIKTRLRLGNEWSRHTACLIRQCFKIEQNRRLRIAGA